VKKRRVHEEHCQRCLLLSSTQNRSHARGHLQGVLLCGVTSSRGQSWVQSPAVERFLKRYPPEAGGSNLFAGGPDDELREVDFHDGPAAGPGADAVGVPPVRREREHVRGCDAHGGRRGRPLVRDPAAAELREGAVVAGGDDAVPDVGVGDAGDGREVHGEGSGRAGDLGRAGADELFGAFLAGLGGARLLFGLGRGEGDGSRVGRLGEDERALGRGWGSSSKLQLAATSGSSDRQQQ